jgi:hypothetical protein
LLQRQMPGAAQEHSLGRHQSHGEICRLSGLIGGVSLGAMTGDCHGRDTRPAMLLWAVKARCSSTRSSLSKSVPCNIIVVRRHRPVENYLKPKVLLGDSSTRVMAPSEKMLLHTILPDFAKSAAFAFMEAAGGRMPGALRFAPAAHN